MFMKMAVILACSLFLATAASPFSEGDYDLLEQYHSIYSDTTSEKESAPAFEKEPAPAVSDAVSEKESAPAAAIDLDAIVSFADLDIRPLLEEIRSHTVTYSHANLFGTANALARYEQLTEYESTEPLQFIEDGKICEEKLRRQIRSNNADYLAGRQGNRYTEMSEEDFDLVFGIVVETLNERMHVADISQLDRNLSRLRLLNTNNQYQGAVENETVQMTINLESCRKIAGDEKIRCVTAHEANHLLQNYSDTEKENEGYAMNMGMQYRWEDLRYNPLYNNWFIEGCAEKLSHIANPDRSKDHDLYKEFVKTLDSFTLSAIADEAVDGATLPELNCQSDLHRLFAFFGAETEEEKEEILNMFYAYNILYEANSGSSSLEKAKDFYRQAFILDTYAWGRQIQASAAETLAKNFYRTLAIRLQDANDVTLRDLFTMLVLEEADLNRVSRNMLGTSYQAGTCARAEHFLDLYLAIQKPFFDLVSECTGISPEDLYQAFDDFYVARKYEFTAETSLLSEEDQAFVTDILDTIVCVKHADNFFALR